jgi:hypothetical protein
MSVSRLAKVLAPPFRATPVIVDWSIIEGALKLRLPDDYKEFIEVYGTGSIGGFLWVLSAVARNPNLDLLVQIEKRQRALHEFAQAEPKAVSLSEKDLGVLVPWGVTDNGDVCYWRTGAEDPNAWPTVVADGRHALWNEFDGTLTGFITAILTNEFESPIFPSDFPSGDVSFQSA